MKKILIVSMIALLGMVGAQRFPGLKPPMAEKFNHIRNIHGDEVNDPYYWMIDYFKRGKDSTRVINYLTAENQYLDKMMTDTKALQEKLFNEMKARIKEKDESVPVFINGYYYYTKTEEGKQYFKYCRKEADINAQEEILLDVNKMAEGKAYYSASGFSISPDNQWLAFGVDDVSRRQYKIYFKNLKTGKVIDDNIANTDGHAVWAKDSKTVFYTSNNPETLLSEKIKRHIVGQSASNDVTVYEEKDKSNYIRVSKSKNGEYIFINSNATTSSEIRYIKANIPNGVFRIFQPRMKNVLYNVIPLEDKFLIYTNRDALNFQVMETPFNKTGANNWKAFIAHRKGVYLESINIFKNYFVLEERANGLNQLVVISRKTGKKENIKFDEPVYTLYGTQNPEYNTDSFRFGYTSMITPSVQYEQNLKTGKRTFLKQ